MPTLNINGQKVKIGDGFLSLSSEQQNATVEEIAASMGPRESVGEDIAKSAGVGLAEGAIGLGGMFRAAGDVGGLAAKKLVELTTGKPSQVEGQFDSPLQTPSSDTIKSGVESVTGKFYEPQTLAGKFANTAAEFIPGGIAAAPKKAISGAIKFGALPGIASEAAGQATEGTAAEPWARAGAAILAGGGAAALDDAGRSSAANRDLLKTAPTRDQIKGASQAAYKMADDAGVVVAPQAIQRTAQKLIQDATNAGFLPKIHPKVNAALEQIVEASGTALPLDRLELSRRVLGSAAKSMEPDERRIASQLIDKFDSEIENLGIDDILSGDLGAATEALTQARSLWSRNRKAEMIEEAVTKADRRSASTGSGGNTDNAIRQNIRAILDNPKKVRGFTPDERAALEKVVRGGPVQNALRLVGKLSPQGSGLMAALGIGGAAINPMLAVPALAGALAKPTATALTHKNVDLASALVRSGGRRKNVPVEDRRALALALAGSAEARSPQ